MGQGAVRVLAGWILVATLLPGPASGAAYKQSKGKQSFGALAYHRTSGNFGYATNMPNARAARVEALRLCGHPQCEVVVSLRNNCGAVANGPKLFSATHGATRQEAETKALRKCGERCEIAGWACTN